MLVLALALSGYASLDRNFPTALSLRLGAVNAEGLVMGEGGQVGGVQLGRIGTIVKPVAVPVNAPVSHTPVTYEVQDGETLKDLATRFKVTVDDLRWSNWSALKNTSKDVTAGQKIAVPPVDGIVVVTGASDTPSSLATSYHVTSDTIIDFNYLRTRESDPLPANTTIVIPGGRGPDFEQTFSGVRGSYVATYRGPGYTVFPFTGTWSVAPGNRFPYGYCTWYAYNRKPVPWNGNAWQWYGNAQAAGWATGQAPRAGSIMVTWESGFGHVAYVESVAANGDWTVSEMNFSGWGVVNARTIHPGGVPLIGFIY